MVGPSSCFCHTEGAPCRSAAAAALLLKCESPLWQSIRFLHFRKRLTNLLSSFAHAVRCC